MGTEATLENALEALRPLFKDALLITSFVFIMMLVIEYLNVLTRGKWDARLRGYTWGQSLLGGLLGAAPGCLGSFAAVSLYAHRVITFGALLANMIATCGDEGFVMMALFPGRALLLFGILLVMGIVSGMLADVVLGRRKTRLTAHLSEHQPVHEHENHCVCFAPREIPGQWKRCSAHRGILSLFLGLFVLGMISGDLGHTDLGLDGGGADSHAAVVERGAVKARVDDHAGLTAHSGRWDWMRLTMLLSGLIGLLIVATVPDHFLDSHLWGHVAVVHIGRIFLWTFGALLFVHATMHWLDLDAWIKGSPLAVLLAACVIGIIPESGPHLVFVTLYAQGAIPFSILLANSIVQDGHGMLPMLAHSRRAFLAIKAVKFVLGLLAGLACLGAGY